MCMYSVCIDKGNTGFRIASELVVLSRLFIVFRFQENTSREEIQRKSRAYHRGLNYNLKSNQNHYYTIL